MRTGGVVCRWLSTSAALTNEFELPIRSMQALVPNPDMNSSVSVMAGGGQLDSLTGDVAGEELRAPARGHQRDTGLDVHQVGETAQAATDGRDAGGRSHRGERDCGPDRLRIGRTKHCPADSRASLH